MKVTVYAELADHQQTFYDPIHDTHFTGWPRKEEVELTGRWYIKDNSGNQDLYIEIKYDTKTKRVTKKPSGFLWFKENVVSIDVTQTIEFVKSDIITYIVVHPVQECN